MRKLFVWPIFLFGLLTFACNSPDTERPTESSVVSQPDTPPAGIPYTLDGPRSELKWTAFKPTSSHHGTVPIGEGTIYIDGDLITGGRVEIIMTGINVRSLDGKKKEDLETHLKGTEVGEEDHFFNVNKYPTATFVILGSEKLDNDPLGTHQINGNLTIKGITHPISFKAVVDMSSGIAMKAVAEPFVIDRSKWNIRYKSKSFYDDLKENFIHDEVRIELTIGAIKNKAG